MSKHTPGPWYVEKHINISYTNTLMNMATVKHDGNDGKTHYICTVNGVKHDGEAADFALANAAIISAAPDLLAALENCVEIMVRAVGEKLSIEKGTLCEEDDWIIDIKNARSAIAKAKGEEVKA